MWSFFKKNRAEKSSDDELPWFMRAVCLTPHLHILSDFEDELNSIDNQISVLKSKRKRVIEKRESYTKQQTLIGEERNKFREEYLKNFGK